MHIESWAVDLSWDAVARFGQDPQYLLPDAFMDDFVQVSEDLAKLVKRIAQRLAAPHNMHEAHYCAYPT